MMSNAYTHYWGEESWNDNRNELEGVECSHCASNQFRKRGIQTGDRIFIVSIDRGEMYLAGRMTVDRIVDQQTAERTLNQKLWPATEHILGRNGSNLNFNCCVPDDIVNKLRFGDDLKLKFTSVGMLDSQTLRGVRQLSDDSAALLDKLIDTNQARVDRIALESVRTLQDIAENFIRFHQEAKRHRDRTKRILARTEYFVHDDNSGAFGPGKFLGYKGMDFAKYERLQAEGNTGAKFNGGVARLFIQAAFGDMEFASNTAFADQCRAWFVSLLGEDIWGNAQDYKWKFLSIAIPGREVGNEYPDEVTQPEKYYEGAIRTVTVSYFERDPVARQKCIAHFGARCQVCNLSFDELYGEVGAGLIHVHHLTQLSEIRKEYEIDPVRDLRPVCPNCHAIIHWKTKKPRSIEDVRTLMLRGR